MKLVVDANVVISALIADSKTRELIVTLEPDLLTLTSASALAARTLTKASGRLVAAAMTVSPQRKLGVSKIRPNPSADRTAPSTADRMAIGRTAVVRMAADRTEGGGADDATSHVG